MKKEKEQKKDVLLDNIKNIIKIIESEGYRFYHNVTTEVAIISIHQAIREENKKLRETVKEENKKLCKHLEGIAEAIGCLE